MKFGIEGSTLEVVRRIWFLIGPILALSYTKYNSYFMIFIPKEEIIVEQNINLTETSSFYWKLFSMRRICGEIQGNNL